MDPPEKRFQMLKAHYKMFQEHEPRRSKRGKEQRKQTKFLAAYVRAEAGREAERAYLDALSWLRFIGTRRGNPNLFQDFALPFLGLPVPCAEGDFVTFAHA
jgi:hypothetical protein